jgi:hypothetical protein
MAANERQARLQSTVEDAIRRLQRECRTDLGILGTWGQNFCDRESCSICRLRNDLIRASRPKDQYQDRPPPLLRLAKAMKAAMQDQGVYVGEKFDPVFNALAAMTTMTDATRLSQCTDRCRVRSPSVSGLRPLRLAKKPLMSSTNRSEAMLRANRTVMKEIRLSSMELSLGCCSQGLIDGVSS